MGKFVKGDVVTIPFPFSDLSGSKHRPAFVVCDLPGEDIILCQITSRAKSYPYAIPLQNSDFLTGSLPVDSFIRPNKIFTADENIVVSLAGHVIENKLTEVLKKIIALLEEQENSGL
jgi:mRNA interferase MazF